MTQKVDFWLLLGVFHGLLQKLGIFCNAVTVEISTFVKGVTKKWPIFGIVV